MKTLDAYKVLTLTHQQAKLPQIGKSVISSGLQQDALGEELRDIRERFGFSELLYLATCNRVMFLFSSEARFERDDIEVFFSYIRPELNSEDLQFVRDHAALYHGAEAIAHLFEVASSINSLVVGEREILRQLREAYDQCLALGSTGDDIRLAMRFTVEAAKDIYSNTRIGEKPVSVVSLAMQRLRSLKPATASRVVFVGAGQTNLLVSKFMPDMNFKRYAVFNRSIAGARELATRLHGQAFRLDEIMHYREGFDVLIVCTGATEAIITPEIYQSLLNGESAEGKVVIDLSIPNNVARETIEAFSPAFIEVEDLRQLARENLAFRQQEVSRAKELLQQHLEEFGEHFRSRQIEIALREVPRQVKAVKDHAMNNVFRNELAGLNDDTRHLVERMLEYMERQCVGIPMKAAKEALLK